jgi:hypothetical protein
VELELKRILETSEGQEPTAAQRKKAEQDMEAHLGTRMIPNSSSPLPL